MIHTYFSDLDVNEDERGDWVGIQMSMKRRRCTVDYLPSISETRRWEDVGVNKQ